MLKANRFENIIFDFGGVIGNDPKKFIFTDISKRFCKKELDIAKAYSKFSRELLLGSISSNFFWTSLSRELGIENFKELKIAWLESFNKNSKLNLNMIKLISELKKQYKLILLSNRTRFYSTNTTKRFINKNFDISINSFEIGLMKPYKEIYDYIIKNYKLTPETCLFIDDNKENLIYPDSIGMKTILFTTYENLTYKLTNIL